MKTNKGWNIGLWVVQGLLAATYLAAGGMKATSAPEEMVKNGLAWVSTMPIGLVRAIGAVELLGAIGIVLPAATRILPWLTTAAAAGLALLQICAAGLHVSRGETANLAVNFTLFALAALVAWGRRNKAPITGREK